MHILPVEGMSVQRVRRAADTRSALGPEVDLAPLGRIPAGPLCTALPTLRRLVSALARLEAPAAPTAAEPIDLVAVCRKVRVDLTPLADARGVEPARVRPTHGHASTVARAAHST